jgi:hypothetical protein
MIERIVRVASSFDEARSMDEDDIARLSFEERISAVERLRRIWFGEDRAESRLERVLEVIDLAPRPVRPHRRPRGGGHGEPRLTEDLDVFVDPTLPNARRLREAMIAFGFGAVAPSAEDLAVPGKVWMLGRKP